jgi:hypothetical protein
MELGLPAKIAYLRLKSPAIKASSYIVHFLLQNLDLLNH